METTRCPFCREVIKADAIKCKHCKSFIVQTSIVDNIPAPRKEDASWFSIPSLILGIISILGVLAIFSEPEAVDPDIVIGLFTASLSGLVLGIVGIKKHTSKSGKNMAATGLILSGSIIGLMIIAIVAAL